MKRKFETYFLRLYNALILNLHPKVLQTAALLTTEIFGSATNNSEKFPNLNPTSFNLGQLPIESRYVRPSLKSDATAEWGKSYRGESLNLVTPLPHIAL